MEIEARNEVTLVGRLAAEAEEKVLPSGDTFTTWRLVVDRPPARRRAPEGARPVTVDTLDCVGWSRAVQRAAAGWAKGDVVALEGSLHRRFFRGATGPSSRYQVEVVKAKRLAKAD